MAPASARYWERLTRFGRVLRFDKRGCGLSDRSAAVTTIAQQVDDVEAVRVAAGDADRIVLSGLSQGAAVAILYALRYPDRVSHLILNQGLVCDAHNPNDASDAARPLVELG